MDFSSADVPISRETWAPRSPVRPVPSSSSSIPAPDSSSGPSRPSEPARTTESYAPPPSAPSAPYQPAPYSSGDSYRDQGNGNGSGNGYSSAPPPMSNSGAYVPPHRQADNRDRAPLDPSRAPRRPPGAPAADPNPVIGVFGLSVRTKERDLEDEFGKYGDVERVTIVYDQRTDRSRGFGFISMRKTEHAAAAIKHLNGYNLHGRVIRVDYSSTQKAHNPTPGQYMGEKKPVHGFDDRYRGRYGEERRDDRRDDRRPDDRPRYDRERNDRYDDRRDRDYRPRRDEDPYGGRSRRDDDRRRSPSPRRRYSRSPERRGGRDYDAPRAAAAPPADGGLRY